MNIYKMTTEKLKELKTWAQVKSPKPFQPALSYALDWLAPELLGTGFRMLEVSDFSLKGLIPARNSNHDFQQEIHQGLILNASLELCRAFLQKQMAESFFHLTASKIEISKKQKWSKDLELLLETDQNVIDEFFINFQKNKKSEIEFEIKITSKASSGIGVEKSKKSDWIKLRLNLEKTELIA